MFSKLAFAIATIAMGVAVSATGENNCGTGSVQCCTYCFLCCCQRWFYWHLSQIPGTSTAPATPAMASLLTILIGSIVAPNTNLGFTCTDLASILSSGSTWYLASFFAWLVPYVGGSRFVIAPRRPFAVQTTNSVSCPMSVMYVYLVVSNYRRTRCHRVLTHQRHSLVGWGQNLFQSNRKYNLLFFGSFGGVLTPAWYGITC